MEIQDRILKVIEYSGLSRSLFSKKIGTQPQTLHHIVSGRRTKPSFDIIEKIILAFPNINSLWLITEKGDFLSTNSYIDVNVNRSPALQNEDERNIKIIQEAGKSEERRKFLNKLLKSNNYIEFDDLYLEYFILIDMLKDYIEHYRISSKMENTLNKYFDNEVNKQIVITELKNTVEIASSFYEIIKPYFDKIEELYQKVSRFDDEHDRIYFD